MIQNTDCGYSLEPPQRQRRRISPGGSNVFSKSMIRAYISKYQRSTGFSSLKNITSMMGAPCNTLFMRCLEYLADFRY